MASRPTGNELYDQLMTYIERSLKLRSEIPDTMTQLQQMKAGKTFGLREMFIGSGYITFDGHLDNVTEFINYNEQLLTHKKGNSRIDIQSVSKELSEKKGTVIAALQKLMDSEIYTTDKKHISVYLLEELKYLEEDSRS